MIFFKKNKKIYLDHASTTPLDSSVLRAMNDVYKNSYFNPGALYAEGVSAAKLVSDSRKNVASLLGTTSDHIIFSRGGTESNNMAIFGVIKKFAEANLGAIPHVIVSEIEHAAVLESVKYLEREKKISLSIAPVDVDGIVDLKELKKLLRPETVLVSIMYVNNEIGTIQPIREVTKLVRWFKKQNTPSPLDAVGALPLRKGETSIYPLVHTDAIQAANYLDINVERLGVDLMSLSGSKIYGPKSSGILYVRNKNLVSSMFRGGDQEFGLRAGTEDVAQVVGFAKALEIAREHSERESARLADLQKFFFEKLREEIPDLIVNGANPLHDSGEGRSARSGVRVSNNVNITIPKISGERLVIELDAKGIAASSRSACSEDSDEESHVIKAIRRANPHPAFGHPLPKGEGSISSSMDGSLRFTMGMSTTKKDVERAVVELGKIVRKIREFEKVLTK